MVGEWVEVGAWSASEWVAVAVGGEMLMYLSYIGEVLMSMS